VIMNTSDYTLKPSSMNSQSRRELLKALEKEDNLQFKKDEMENPNHAVSTTKHNNGNNALKKKSRVERLGSTYQKREMKVEDPYGNVIVENMSVNSMGTGFLNNLKRGDDGDLFDEDDSVPNS